MEELFRAADGLDWDFTNPNRYPVSDGPDDLELVKVDDALVAFVCTIIAPTMPMLTLSAWFTSRFWGMSTKWDNLYGYVSTEV